MTQKKLDAKQPHIALKNTQNFLQRAKETPIGSVGIHGL
jgi:hypothetical protein